MFLIIIGSVGQWLALISCVAGIIIEVRYQADIGFLSITIGSVLWGVMTKIKLTGYEKNDRHKSKKSGSP